MHIASQSPTELVVKASTVWISAICGASALASTSFSVVENKPNGLFGAAFFLFVAIAFARRTVFTFDAMQRIVRWNGYKPFKSISGSIPFDEVSDITVDASVGGHNVPTYRLSLQTARGATPMAFVYSGSNDGYASLRRTILTFMKPGQQEPRSDPHAASGAIPVDLDSSIRSLLQQGRKIDAIALLRTRERIGLTEAVQRIDAVNARIKAESPIQPR
jgi:hypothetical protein